MRQIPGERRPGGSNLTRPLGIGVRRAGQRCLLHPPVPVGAVSLGRQQFQDSDGNAIDLTTTAGEVISGSDTTWQVIGQYYNEAFTVIAGLGPGKVWFGGTKGAVASYKP